MVVRMTAHELGLFKVCYSIGETAALLSTSRDAIYAMDKRGEIKIVKLGPKKSRVFGADIAAYLNDLRQQRAGQAA
jgi:excisionase family DNA binding protein